MITLSEKWEKGVFLPNNHSIIEKIDDEHETAKKKQEMTYKYLDCLCMDNFDKSLINDYTVFYYLLIMN